MKTTVFFDELGASHNMIANFGLGDRIEVSKVIDVMLYKEAQSDGLLITYLKILSDSSSIKHPIHGTIEFNFKKKRVTYDIGTEISAGEYINILDLFEIETNY